MQVCDKTETNTSLKGQTDHLTWEYADGVLSFTVSGDIDHHNAAPLREAADRLLYYYRPRLVLLRLHAVDFMDSAGLGFFMGRYKLCKSLGAAFRLIDPPERVVKMLTMSGMDKKLAIEKVYRGEKKEKTEKTEKTEKAEKSASTERTEV